MLDPFLRKMTVTLSFYHETVISLIVSGFTISLAYGYIPKHDRPVIRLLAAVMIPLDVASVGFASQALYRFTPPLHVFLFPMFAIKYIISAATISTIKAHLSQQLCSGCKLLFRFSMSSAILIIFFAMEPRAIHWWEQGHFTISRVRINEGRLVIHSSVTRLYAYILSAMLKSAQNNWKLWATTDNVDTPKGSDSGGFSTIHPPGVRLHAPFASSDGRVPGVTFTDDDLPPIYGDDEPEGDTTPGISGALKLAVQGQGVVAVKVTPGMQFSITLTPSPDLVGDETALKLKLTETSAKFFAVSLNATTEIPSIAPRGAKAAFLIPGVEDLYWLSVDKKNGLLRYGRTYKSASATCLEAKVDVGDKTTKAGLFIWVKSLKYISIVSVTESASSECPGTNMIAVGSLPIVRDLPPIVAEPTEITLENLSANTVTCIGNLSPECQRLYANVASPGMTLDDKDFPDFSQAIEYSIRTPGKLCFEKLKEKANEFGGDPTMTYLRVTLGSDEGNSPGAPLVVEIWPSQHRSPIHDHGEAYAIIRVLHGEISTSYFTKLDDQSSTKIEPGFTFRKGDVTWIGPDNYQVHQLCNNSDRVCVTIQCYQYASEDFAHDEYFEYLESETGARKLFYPDSDWGFVTFKKKIRAEWAAYLKEIEWK